MKARLHRKGKSEAERMTVVNEVTAIPPQTKSDSLRDICVLDWGPPLAFVAQASGYGILPSGHGVLYAAKTSVKDFATTVA